MFLEERHNKILEILNKHQSVKVKTLSEMLSTSEVTIRRDLEELQRQQKVVRTHGGAMSAYMVGKAVVAKQLSLLNVDVKKRIAQVAYDQLCDHDTVLLDSSSTVHEILPLFISGPKTGLRVITTSLRLVVALENCANCTVQVVGGDINYLHGTTEGSMALRYIRDIRVDKCFFGINGISPDFGFSTPRYEDADIKAAMVHASNYSYILSDHSKFGKTYLAKTTSPDCVITDTRLGDFPYDDFENTDFIFADEIAGSES